MTARHPYVLKKAVVGGNAFTSSNRNGSLWNREERRSAPRELWRPHVRERGAAEQKWRPASFTRMPHALMREGPTAGVFGESRDQASYLLMISGKHRRDLVSLSSSEQASHVTATQVLPTCTPGR